MADTKEKKYIPASITGKSDDEDTSWMLQKPTEGIPRAKDGSRQNDYDRQDAYFKALKRTAPTEEIGETYRRGVFGQESQNPGTSVKHFGHQTEEMPPSHLFDEDVARLYSQ